MLCPCAQYILNIPSIDGALGSSESSAGGVAEHVEGALQHAAAGLEASPGFCLNFSYRSREYWALKAGPSFDDWGVVGTRGLRPHCYTCSRHRGTCVHVQQLVAQGVVEDPGSRHTQSPTISEEKCVCAMLHSHGTCFFHAVLCLPGCRHFLPTHNIADADTCVGGIKFGTPTRALVMLCIMICPIEA